MGALRDKGILKLPLTTDFKPWQPEIIPAASPGPNKKERLPKLNRSLSQHSAVVARP
jgi:hypothetical protein